MMRALEIIRAAVDAGYSFDVGSKAADLYRDDELDGQADYWDSRPLDTLFRAAEAALVPDPVLVKPTKRGQRAYWLHADGRRVQC